MANERARDLRKTMSVPERKLWRALSGRKVSGLRFRRQHPIGPFIADFVCLERQLVVEVDGSQHALGDQIEYDIRRTEWLKAEGYRVIRFWSNDVMQSLDGVVQSILEAAMNASPSCRRRAFGTTRGKWKCASPSTRVPGRRGGADYTLSSRPEKLRVRNFREPGPILHFRNTPPGSRLISPHHNADLRPG